MRGESALFAEEFDVGGGFVEGFDFAALDDLADLFDDVRIGEGGDVAGIHVIGNSGQDTAHDFSGAGFGHVRNDVDALGASDFADHGLDGVHEFFGDRFVGHNAGLQGNINFRDAALHFIDYGYDGGFGDFMHGEAGGFQLLGAEAMAGDVDDVIDPAEVSGIAVKGKHGAVSRVVRPIVPIFTQRIFI